MDNQLPKIYSPILSSPGPDSRYRPGKVSLISLAWVLRSKKFSSVRFAINFLGLIVASFEAAHLPNFISDFNKTLSCNGTSKLLLSIYLYSYPVRQKTPKPGGFMSLKRNDRYQSHGPKNVVTSGSQAPHQHPGV